MKKLAKLKLQNLSVLDAKKMQELKGGRANRCLLTCLPLYQHGILVDNCSEETFAKYHCDRSSMDETDCIC